MAMAYNPCDHKSSLPSASSSSSSSSSSSNTSLIAHSLHHKWAQTVNSKINGGVGKCGAVGRGRAGAAVMNNNVGMMSIRAVQAPPSRFDIGIYEESSTSSKKKKKVEEVKEKLKEMGEMQQKEQERRAEWSVSSWRSMMQLQQGEEEEEEEEEVVAVAEFPPLVFAGEAARLEERLAQAAAGRAFVLQAEDCSGHDRLCAHSIRDTFRVLLQMAAVLMFGGQMPVIKMGCLADLPPSSAAVRRRLPDGHMIDAYSRSAATLNLLRSFANGGYAAMQRITQWNLDFTSHSAQGYRYLELARRVDDALGFMSALGLTAEHPVMRSTDFWTSHECLLLPYEQALTRLDSTTGRFYDCSAHMLWLPPDHTTSHGSSPHIEFLRGVANPIAIKASDRMDPVELVRVCEILNPENKAGRLTVIVRMGAHNLRQKLPHLIRAVRQAGIIVTWLSDPMHGNTVVVPASGLKTRPFQAILDEVEAFFDVHESEGSHAGGIHLEMTGQNVTECTGGSREVKAEELHQRYLTNCDPRLNASQSLELAFIIASRLRKHKAGQQQPSFPV